MISSPPGRPGAAPRRARVLVRPQVHPLHTTPARALLVLLVGAALLVASRGRAAELLGTYQGTLGKQPVVACFEGTHGAYYYVKYGRGIPLSASPEGVWTERRSQGDSTGRWTLETPTGEALTGLWQAPDGARTAPISLTRLGNGGSGACDSSAFNGPRVGRAARKALAIQTVGDLRVEPFAALGGHVKGVTLEAPDEAHAKTAAALERLNQDLIAEYLLCNDLFYESAAVEGEADFHGELTVELVSPRWVVVTRSAGYYCGGAHPDGSFHAEVLSRATGSPVELSDWLQQAPDALGHRFVKGKGECRDAIADSSFEVWPTAKGLAFLPNGLPHVVAACGDTVVVPWSRLARLLTPAGKDAARELAAAGKKQRRP